MPTDEILHVISKKGKMIQDVFYPIYISLVERYYDEFDSVNINESLIEVCYNATRTVIERIINNQSYYANVIYLSQRSLERARKDLGTMPRLDYSDIDNAEHLRHIEELCAFPL